MARLPDANAVGGLPSLRVSPNIPRMDVSGYAAGARHLGEGLSKLGNDLTSIAIQGKEKADRLSAVQAEADFSILQEKMFIEQSQNPDYRAAPGAFSSDLYKTRDEIASGISDPTRRAEFIAKSNVGIEHRYNLLEGKGRDQFKNETLVENDGRIDTLMRNAFSKPDDVAFQKEQFDTAKNLVQEEIIRFRLTPAQARARMRQIDEKFAGSWATDQISRDPVGALDKINKFFGQDGKVVTPPKPAPGVGPQSDAGTNTRRVAAIDASPVGALIDKYAKQMGVDPSVAKTIASIESGGRPGARTGSYSGVYQLSASEFEKHGGGDILNAEDNVRAGLATLRAKSDAFERKFGRSPDATEIYLMHQQGEAGAANHYSNPNGVAWENMFRTGEGRQKGERWAKAAIWGNIPDQIKAQFPGGVDTVTSQDFINIWRSKVTGGAPSAPVRVASADNGVMSDASPVGEEYSPIKTGTPLDLLPINRIVQFHEAATKAVDAQSGKLKDTIELGIKTGQITDPSSFLNDKRLRDKDKSSLLSTFKSWDSDFQKNKIAIQLFDNPAKTFNPFDKEDKDAVDRVYKQEAQANPNRPVTDVVDSIVTRTGIVPPSVSTQIRGAFVSPDPQKVAAGARMAVSLMSRNRNIFAGEQGREDIEGNATKYEHYSELWGPEGAAQRLAQENDPAFKARVPTLKGDDLDKIVKDNVRATDIGKEFGSWWSNAKVGFTLETKLQATRDYEEVFKDELLKTANGDVNEARKQAFRKLKNLYAPTNVNGSNTVMRFAPEGAAAYKGIDNVSDKIAAQAVEAIKNSTGQVVNRKDLVLAPVPFGQTASVYDTGEPPPYYLFYRTPNGLETAKGAFVADPQRMRDEISAERQKAFDTRPAHPRPKVEYGNPLSELHSSGKVKTSGNVDIVGDVIQPAVKMLGQSQINEAESLKTVPTIPDMTKTLDPLQRMNAARQSQGLPLLKELPR